MTVTDDTFAELVLGSRLPVVVDFWAAWCPPCGPLAKTLAELSGEFTGKLVIATLNIDENPAAGRDYRVMSLPTLMFFKRGAVVHTIVGSRPRSSCGRRWPAPSRRTRTADRTAAGRVGYPTPARFPRGISAPRPMVCLMDADEGDASAPPAPGGAGGDPRANALSSGQNTQHR